MEVKYRYLQVFIIYSNLSRLDIREHGAGYYKFSTEEVKRQEQMKRLEELRQKVFPYSLLLPSSQCFFSPGFQPANDNLASLARWRMKIFVSS